MAGDASERVLIAVPAYNCARQLPRVIRQLDDAVKAWMTELLIVDNVSSDGTAPAAIAALKEIGEPPATLLQNAENLGYGGSMKVIFDYALHNNFDFLVILHGDDQAEVHDIAPLIASGAHRKLDCLLGARFMRGSQLSGYSAFRTFGNRVFNAIFSMLLGRRLFDLGSGLNLYRVASLRDRYYDRAPDDLTFDYYGIISHVRTARRILFFPISWREEDQISNVSLVRQAMRSLGMVASSVVRGSAFFAKPLGRGQEDRRSPNILYTNTTRLWPQDAK